MLPARSALAAQDPTRPPARTVATAAAVPGAGTAEAAPLPALRYIRYSTGRRVAMIGDDLLGEGQSGHGVTVRRILPDAVVIVHKGKEITLKMFAPEATAPEIDYANQE
ncbi:MAG: hypothetical protein K0R03_2013 [Moraxellaceae bacterium]|jgi:hypothetical protein|nr:hypothetical protein [Moraxellaceae bacterium]